MSTHTYSISFIIFFVYFRCHTNLWPLDGAASSHSECIRVVRTWPLGIQHGSGGKERVIGLRSAILSPDWTGRCERGDIERRESWAPAAVGPLSPRWLCRYTSHTRAHTQTHVHTQTGLRCDLTRGIQWVSVGFFFSVSRMMGGDRRRATLAVPATWVTALLCALTSVCAVEGRCAWRGQWCRGDAGWGLDSIHARTVVKAQLTC